MIVNLVWLKFEKILIEDNFDSNVMLDLNIVYRIKFYI